MMAAGDGGPKKIPHGGEAMREKGAEPGYLLGSVIRRRLVRLRMAR
jgi:hypothetical protein